MTGRRRPPEPTAAQLLRLRHDAKRQLRKRLDAIRRAIPADKRAERSRIITARVIAHEAFVAAEVITAYVAMKGEVDPRPIVEAAWAHGKTVVLPRIDWGEETMFFHRYDADTELEESGMGFLQPPKTSALVEDEDVDLVLTPALAVDERGHRIGFGKGYYDRFLERLPRATAIALIFDFQRLAEVPDTPGDVPVDHWAWDGGIHAPIEELSEAATSPASPEANEPNEADD